MKKTLEVLNRLVREKVIDDYAIGGAMCFNLKERFDKWQLQ